MTQRVIYHAGTDTIIGLDDGTFIVDVPDELNTLEEMEEFCKQDMVVTTVRIDMPYCNGILKEPASES